MSVSPSDPLELSALSEEQLTRKRKREDEPDEQQPNKVEKLEHNTQQNESVNVSSVGQTITTTTPSSSSSSTVISSTTASQTTSTTSSTTSSSTSSTAPSAPVKPSPSILVYAGGTSRIVQQEVTFVKDVPVSITLFRQNHSVQNLEMEHVISFLTSFDPKTKSSAIHQVILTKLIERMLDKIQSEWKDEKLITLLEHSLPYIGLDELRIIPISLLQHILHQCRTLKQKLRASHTQQMPEQAKKLKEQLNGLREICRKFVFPLSGNQKILETLPLDIRREAYALSPQLGEQVLKPIFEKLTDVLASTCPFDLYQIPSESKYGRFLSSPVTVASAQSLSNLAQLIGSSSALYRSAHKYVQAQFFKHDLHSSQPLTKLASILVKMDFLNMYWEFSQGIFDTIQPLKQENLERKAFELVSLDKLPHLKASDTITQAEAASLLEKDFSASLAQLFRSAAQEGSLQEKQQHSITFDWSGKLPNTLPCAQLCHVSLICYHPASLSIILSTILKILQGCINEEKLPKADDHIRHICWLLLIALDINVMAEEDANTFPLQPSEYLLSDFLPIIAEMMVDVQYDFDDPLAHSLSSFMKDPHCRTIILYYYLDLLHRHPSKSQLLKLGQLIEEHLQDTENINETFNHAVTHMFYVSLTNLAIKHKSWLAGADLVLKSIIQQIFIPAALHVPFVHQELLRLLLSLHDTIPPKELQLYLQRTNTLSKEEEYAKASPDVEKSGSVQGQIVSLSRQLRQLPRKSSQNI